MRNDSHNIKWIDYEMNVATSKQLPIIGVRIPNTYGLNHYYLKNEIYHL